MAIITYNIPLLEWVISTGYKPDFDDFDSAVVYFNIEVIEFLIQVGCPKIFTIAYIRLMNTRIHPLLYRKVCRMIMWMKNHGLRFNEHISNLAIVYEHLEIVKFLYENGCPFDSSGQFMPPEDSEMRTYLKSILPDLG